MTTQTDSDSGAQTASISVSGARTCVVCGEARARDSETASVRSNVRAFKQESFRVWRCSHCRSIHAQDEVDLEHYYRHYPVFAAELDWKLEVVYAGMLRRLVRAGLRKQHRILDYGCGKGLLVRFLREHGYAGAVGYDRFAEGWNDPSVLEHRYDCIVSQDVIEHVDDPLALLARFDALAEPSAIISIGTPDAEALDLQAPERYVHALHLPYHRHILAAPALRHAGEQLGWEVSRYYSTMYNNTLFPTMNPRFVLHYVRCHDDAFDLVAEPIRLSLRLCNPLTLFYAFFGYFFDRHTDIQVVFRKAGPRALAA
jgi:2-polyprenyl-3-methyl-5-hydroxy-6-metoxy-1,4-benzoquinol methylase